MSNNTDNKLGIHVPTDYLGPLSDLFVAPTNTTTPFNPRPAPGLVTDLVGSTKYKGLGGSGPFFV